MSDKINLMNNYTKIIYHIKLVAILCNFLLKKNKKQNIINERVQKESIF